LPYNKVFHIRANQIGRIPHCANVDMGSRRLWSKPEKPKSFSKYTGSANLTNNHDCRLFSKDGKNGMVSPHSDLNGRANNGHPIEVTPVPYAFL